jgi:hypothetical protein
LLARCSILRTTLILLEDNSRCLIDQLKGINNGEPADDTKAAVAMNNMEYFTFTLKSEWIVFGEI